MSTVISDDEVKKNIAANIAQTLHLMGKTQGWLANQVGVTPAAISLIVSGDRMPGAGVLRRIAEALNVRMDRLIDTAVEKIST
jgi:transcriptional regulator with XRE-family HTH domain